MAEASYSRTKKGLKNSAVALVFQVISLLVGFFSRKLFLDYLGTEILGLNTTASSILGFLNLAELGIGSAIAVTLYRPLYEGNEQEVREITALQGWLYKWIATIIIGASIVLMFFFPSIFSKSELPIWYAYVSFIALMMSSMMSYFFNYKQIVLSADQNEYKIQYSYRVIMILKLVVQALAVKHFSNPFLWWAGLEIAATLLATVAINITIYTTYPYLKEKVEDPGALRFKFPGVVTKVKQLFVHKISSFVLGRATPLFVYAFTSLSMVAVYGNYTVLTSNLNNILAALASGLYASVGSMVASRDEKLIMKVFREIFTTRFIVSSVCCLCLWFTTQPFITLWIGDEFLLSDTTLAWIIFGFLLGSLQITISVFINAYGLFRDVWAPVAEAVTTILLALLLGPKYGLDGILAGRALVVLLLYFTWKPYFLFHYGMGRSIMIYIGITLKHVLVLAGVFFATRFLVSMITLDPYSSFLHWAAYAMIIFSAVSVMFVVVLYAVEPGMRTFVERMLRMLRSRKSA